MVLHVEQNVPVKMLPPVEFSRKGSKLEESAAFQFPEILLGLAVLLSKNGRKKRVTGLGVSSIENILMLTKLQILCGFLDYVHELREILPVLLHGGESPEDDYGLASCEPAKRLRSLLLAEAV
jgi:hypothetical protein